MCMALFSRLSYSRLLSTDVSLHKMVEAKFGILINIRYGVSRASSEDPGTCRALDGSRD